MVGAVAVGAGGVTVAGDGSEGLVVPCAAWLCPAGERALLTGVWAEFGGRDWELSDSA